MMSSVPSCKACGIEFDDGIMMTPCPKCDKVQYCSQDCLLWDWGNGGHKRACEGADGSSLETTNTFDTDPNSVDAFSIISGESGSILAALKAVRGGGSPIRINISSMQQKSSRSPSRQLNSPNQFTKVRNKVQPISPLKTAMLQHSESSSTGSALLKSGEEKKEESAEKRTPLVKHAKSRQQNPRTVDTTETEGDYFVSRRMENVDHLHKPIAVQDRQTSFEKVINSKATFEQPDTNGFPTTQMSLNTGDKSTNQTTPFTNSFQDGFFFTTPQQQPDADNPESSSDFLSTRTPHSRPSITPTIDETLQFNGQTPTPFSNQAFSFNQKPVVSNNRSQPTNDVAGSTQTTSSNTWEPSNDIPDSTRTTSALSWDPNSEHPESTRTTSTNTWDRSSDNPESTRTTSTNSWDPTSEHPDSTRTMSTNTWGQTADNPQSTRTTSSTNSWDPNIEQIEATRMMSTNTWGSTVEATRTTSTNVWDPTNGSKTTRTTSTNTWDSSENPLVRQPSTNTWNPVENPLALTREASTNTWEPQQDPFEADASDPSNPPHPSRTTWSWSDRDKNRNNAFEAPPRQKTNEGKSNNTVRIHRTVPLETAFDRWTRNKSFDPKGDSQSWKQDRSGDADDNNDDFQPVVGDSKEQGFQEVRSSPPSNSFVDFKSISDDPNLSTGTLDHSDDGKSDIQAAPSSDPIDTTETPKAKNRQRAVTDFESSSNSAPDWQSVDRSFPSTTNLPQQQHQMIDYEGANLDQLVFQPHKALAEEPEIVVAPFSETPSSDVEAEPEIVVAPFPDTSFGLQEETEPEIFVASFSEFKSTVSGVEEEAEPDIVVKPFNETPSALPSVIEEADPEIVVTPFNETPSTPSIVNEESEPEISVAPIAVTKRTPPSEESEQEVTVAPIPMTKRAPPSEESEQEITVAPIPMTKRTPPSEESEQEITVAPLKSSKSGKPSDEAVESELSQGELPVNVVRSADGTVHKQLVVSVVKTPENAFKEELREEPTKRFQNYRKFLNITRSEGEALVEHYIGSSLKAASTCAQIYVVGHAPREENERDSTATTDVSFTSKTESDEDDEVLNEKLNSYLCKVSSGSKKAPSLLKVPEPPMYASSASESEVQDDDIEMPPHPLSHRNVEAASMSVPMSLPKTDRTEHAPINSQKSAPLSSESSIGSYDPDKQEVVVDFGGDLPPSTRYEQQKSLERAIKGNYKEEEKQDTFVYYQLMIICLALTLGAIFGILRNVGGGESNPSVSVLTKSPVEVLSAAPSLPVFVPTSEPSTSPTSSLAPSIAPTESIPTLPTPTEAPTDVPLLDILRSKSTDNGASLEDTTSSQYRAFQWLSNNSGLEDFSEAVKIQRYALATLYYSTEGDSWDNNTGWLSDDSECTWFSKSSVFPTCRLNVFVTLELNENGLQGTIPPELGLLTKLERVELRGDLDRFIAGTLPSEVAMMTRLDSLVVTGNRLTGEIPAHLGKLNLLRRLDLSQNNFVGKIPSELGEMIGLTDLFLSSNQLTGTFPPELGDLENLLSLSVGVNKLTGEIPEEIGHLQELHYLYLELNRFTRMPTDLGLLSKLTIFTAADNIIEESIPSELGNMASLSSLILRGNKLNSLIPVELGNLADKLVHLDLSFNALSGPIPTEFGLLTELRTLELQENFLTGRVPSVLSQLVTLDELRLESNTLTGSIPTELCDAFDVSPFMFFSDCDIEVDCTCCTHCCSDDRLECSCTYAGTELEFLCGDVF